MGQTCKSCNSATIETFDGNKLPNTKFLTAYTKIKKANQPRNKILENQCTVMSGDNFTGLLDKQNNMKGYGQLRKGNNFYAGMLKDNLPHGQGILIQNDNYCYYGQFKSGKMHGKGKQFKKQISFDGQFFEGEKVKGKLIHPQFVYQGQFRKSQFDGIGKIQYQKTKTIYEGELKNGSFHGKGILRVKNTFQYKGSFKQGNYEGAGIVTYANGETYSGQFHQGVKQGYGSIKINNVQYAGQWKKGIRCGKGIVTSKGQTYFGQWQHNKVIDLKS